MKVDPAFAELYQSEFQAVFRAVFLLCGNREVAQDATQEAFARALARWRRLRHAPWAAGWVTTTALNAARRLLRRMPEIEQRAPAEETNSEQAIDLWRAVRALPRRQQEAVALYYVVDLSVAEAARVMRCEEGTVKAHLARARATLKRRLEEARDDR